MRIISFNDDAEAIDREKELFIKELAKLDDKKLATYMNHINSEHRALVNTSRFPMFEVHNRLDEELKKAGRKSWHEIVKEQFELTPPDDVEQYKIKRFKFYVDSDWKWTFYYTWWVGDTMVFVVSDDCPEDFMAAIADDLISCRKMVEYRKKDMPDECCFVPMNVDYINCFYDTNEVLEHYDEETDEYFTVPVENETHYWGKISVKDLSEFVGDSLYSDEFKNDFGYDWDLFAAAYNYDKY